VRAILTEEQELLKATAGRIAASARVGGPADLPRIDRAAAWRALADAGLLGMRRRGADGAPLASGVELMLVTQALAGALVPVPFVGVALAAELLARAAAPAGLEDAIEAGAARTTLLLDAGLAALASGAGEAVCVDAEGAEFALALTDDDGDGARLRRVRLAPEAARDGVDLTRPIAAVAPGGAAGEPVGAPLGDADLQAWTALALTLVSADIVGVLRAGLERLVDYAKTRIQYGAPIGSFQAVQHMCAEMLVEVEASASVVNYAAWAVDALPPADALLAARTAKAFCGPAAQQVSETLMQAFGGIGQVWEHEAHLRTRRAMFDRKLLGDEAHQLLAIAAARQERG
jgi:alkylation response protein AidB-like acyl-CoA dehydrogenase